MRTIRTWPMLLGTLVLVLTVPGCDDASPAAGGEPDGGAGPGPSLPPGGGGGGEGGAGGEGGEAPPAGCGEEICNAEDDDCDGQVDEAGCACEPNGTPACYGGPPGTRGVGVCADGARGCDDLGELWGACEGWRGPGIAEVCGNGEDEDCDGRADEDCEGCAADETCGDGLDQDCDGLVDEGCADHCAPEETCGNGIDDDCDGRVDDGCGCQAEEVCGNDVDEDCDLIIDEGCLPCHVDDTCAECDAEETCDDGIDNDCNGQIDDGCDGCQLRERCDGERDEDCDGQVDEGCDCAGQPEICADHADNDCDGRIDEQPCEPPDGRPERCNPDLRRACFGANPAHIGVGICAAGTQVCAPDGRWGPCEGAVLPREEICDNGVDEDCEGHVDNCVVQVVVDLHGDCITTRCPAQAPFPVGCDIVMHGGDHRGCVASRPDDPVVYFQEGDQCGAGRVTGRLSCSNVQGMGLNEQNCRINKQRRFYPRDRSGCPETN